jgi:uncharacterized protein (TIGR03435 family)
VRRLTVAVVLLLTGAVGAVPLRSQAREASDQKAAFDVASIKPHVSFDTPSNLQFTPDGGLRAVNVSLLVILATAYSDSMYALRLSQIIGAPNWVQDERYDISANAPDNAGDRTFVGVRMRLRTLLEDRFKLRAHRDRRPMPVYALVRQRADGALGPDLTPSTVDCEKQAASCGLMQGGPVGRIASDAVTPAILSTLLGNVTGRMVVDRTRLTGWFRVDLEWSPEQTASDKPSLFTAVQEQLGLRLESTRGLVDVLMIDAVDKPTAD